MSFLPDQPDLYEEAGIRDLAEFYADRFVTGGVFDARYFNPINRFNMKYARTMWVYDNVRAESEVLDIGCGEGLLALLAQKGVRLTGLDISPQLAEIARRNGYSDVRIAPFTCLPFADASFDYVVSLDVLGHVDFAEKDAVLGEMRRVLRPGGVTLHGIETLDAERFGSYEAMNEEERARFVRIDGHIGLETERATANRFARFFRYVAWEGRYALCLSSEEFLKQADEYRRPFEADFIAYLRGLSFRERQAFDMAMGYVFSKISDLHLKLPASGLYMLLKASDAPLESFYNAHRDRRALLGITEPDNEKRVFAPASFCLDSSPHTDFSPHVLFDSGWYDADWLPPVARWMSERGRITVRTTSATRITLDLTTHIPDLRAAPIEIEFIAQGERCAAFTLIDYGWLEVEIDLPKDSRMISANGVLELETRASRTWRPSEHDAASNDDRDLSIAVCNIELFT